MVPIALLIAQAQTYIFTETQNLHWIVYPKQTIAGISNISPTHITWVVPDIVWGCQDVATQARPLNIGNFLPPPYPFDPERNNFLEYRISFGGVQASIAPGYGAHTFITYKRSHSIVNGASTNGQSTGPVGPTNPALGPAFFYREVYSRDDDTGTVQFPGQPGYYVLLGRNLSCAADTQKDHVGNWEFYQWLFEDDGEPIGPGSTP